MTNRLTRLRTLAALGPANGVRVLAYRAALRFGVHPVQRIAATVRAGDYFHEPLEAPVAAHAPAAWRGEALLFGAHRVPIGTEPPTWLCDPIAGTMFGDADRPWWTIGDFTGADIKRVWEWSRFDWAMAFAQQARAADGGATARLNGWIADWVAHNPPYRGPNWKCAQEASIRLLHLSASAIILEQDHDLSASLHSLLVAHLRRIAPTLSYARAQDNNHATSEAAALFVAGAWLSRSGVADGRGWERKGRRLLERHVARLFGKDGSFSQYSLNYHRFALDTLSLAEVWRRRAGLPPFSARLRARAAAATEWLRVMVDPDNGDAPNLGANDGANLLPLTDAAYRDYRPAVQLASALFLDAKAYPPGPWDGALRWLGVEEAVRPAAEVPATAIFDDGGYAVLRQGRAMALLRYPRFRFRPSQADVLHVDLWVEGENLLRDGGTYSYNTDQHWIEYFGGVASHNSIQFDGQPQMPRVSRFLLGDWLTTESRGLSGDDEARFHASYRDRRGWRHRRELMLGHDRLRVIDDVAGFANEAVLRWRLSPGAWRIDGDTVTDGRHRLIVSAEAPVVRAALVSGHEARHYLEKTEVPVLEVTVADAGRVTSEYIWSS